MYPDFNSSFHFLGYIKEQDDLNAIPGMKRIPEFWAQPQGNFRSLPVTPDKLVGFFFLFKGNIYLLHRNTVKINSFACHVKHEMCWETDLSGGSAKGSYGAVSIQFRRKCLVGSVDFNLLALSLPPQRTHQGRKERVSGTGSSFQSIVENALWPSAQVGADCFHVLTAGQVLSLA